MATKSNDAKTAIKTGRVKEGINYWCALFDYDAKLQDELTLKRGTQVEVITKDPKVSGSDGWWTGKVDNKVGVFPSNFVTADVTPPKATAIREIKFCDLKLGDVIGKF
ncbi:mlk-1 [Bugula neritina]|uniref:Mlk-1 n=1 Tax=Bugula neritina TaxID=10212 RepID=A0A7J7IWR6_BUGNE|nr:mlk-1 [Bugula neritina]